MNNRIAILVVFFNKLSQTMECIDSFLPGGQQIYVLNNGSDAPSWKSLQQKYHRHQQVKLFSIEINIGPAAGRNFLLKQCNEEWIFIVDNDTTIQPADNWKALFDKKQVNENDAAIFCPAIFNVHENCFAQPQQFRLENREVYMEESSKSTTNYFSCCGVIIHRKIFEAYGDFDAALFAFEDYEFSIRAICSPLGELKVYPIPEIILNHDHRVQQKKADRKAVHERYNEVRIATSMQHVMEKHRIKFDHHWQWWTRKQVSEMAGKTFLQKIKQRIAGLAGS